MALDSILRVPSCALRFAGRRWMGITSRPGDRASEHGRRLPVAKPPSSPEAVEAEKRQEFVRQKGEEAAAQIREVEKEKSQVKDEVGSRDGGGGEDTTAAAEEKTAVAVASEEKGRGTEEGKEEEEQVQKRFVLAEAKEKQGKLYTYVVYPGREPAVVEKVVDLSQAVFPPWLEETTDQALLRALQLYDIRRAGLVAPEDLPIAALRREHIL